MQPSNTLTRKEPKEAIHFRVPASFKLAVDMAVTRRRSTLREVCTEALAKYLGIALPRDSQETVE